jgi:hypothetical protein
VTDDPQSANRAIREAADRLVAERGDLPPGSVLRCFSKSVRTALLRGYAVPEVAAVAERLTRQELALRPVGEHRHRRAGRWAMDLRVPRPRTAS